MKDWTQRRSLLWGYVLTRSFYRHATIVFVTVGIIGWGYIVSHNI